MKIDVEVDVEVQIWNDLMKENITVRQMLVLTVTVIHF